MNGFTKGREACDLPRPKTVSLRKIRIDSRGRISIPSDLRKSLGLRTGSDILMGFDLKEGIIFLVCGQGGVRVSTKDCGSFSLGSNLEVSESPGPDPKEARPDLEQSDKVGRREWGDEDEG